MKRLLLAFLLIPIFSAAQDTGKTLKFSHDWHDGEIIFSTGEKLRCQLRYNRASLDGVVHILDGEETIAVTKEFVREFAYYDSLKGRIRKFVNMTLPGFKVEKDQFLVEKIYDDGKFAIINQRTYELPYQRFELIRFLGKPVPVYRKYIVDLTSGEFVPLSRENAMQLLSDRRNEVSTYVSANHLRFKKVADFIDVFEYHNSL